MIETPFGNFPDNFARYVRPTKIADSDHADIRRQKNACLQDVNTHLQAIKAIHEFVASLPIGFDREDLPASKILKLGRGQCNTKTNLFVALMRAARLPVRIHGWQVYKSVHKDNFPSLVYAFTPSKTLFTYPEVYYKDKWQLLTKVLRKKKNASWSTCPFDDAYARSHPLKKEWIAEDLGSLWHPDTFYEKYGTNADGWRRLAFPIAKKMLND